MVIKIKVQISLFYLDIKKFSNAYHEGYPLSSMRGPDEITWAKPVSSRLYILYLIATVGHYGPLKLQKSVKFFIKRKTATFFFIPT